MRSQWALMSPVVRQRVAAERGRPLPGRIPAVLAEREDDGAAGGLESFGHLVVGGDHEAHLLGFVVGCLLLHDRFDEAAEVVLEVVDAPGGVHLCVLLLVAQRGDVTAAGLGSGAGVDADLEALGVDVVGEGLHVRELGVGVQHAAGVALGLPGVVDVDVDVAGVLHAGGDELVGGVADVLVGDLVGKVVPAIPAHGRCQSNLLRRSWSGRKGNESQGEGGKGQRSGKAHSGILLETISMAEEWYARRVGLGNIRKVDCANGFC